MPEKVSARGLLEKLGLRSKKPEAVTPPESAATEAPPAQELAPASGLPDWLSAPSAVEPTPTPTPESAVAAPAVTPEADIVAPAVPEPSAEVAAPSAPVAAEPAEAPTAAALQAPPEAPLPVKPMVEAAGASPTVEMAKSPEQQAIEQFEEALLSADDALAKLRVGESLNEMQLRAAKAAAATANGLIRNLPEHYLKVLLASRRLGENQEYTRLDFQKDALAAIRVFSQANKG